MRFFNFLLGLLCVFAGMAFVTYPAGNYIIYSYISAIAMGITGIGSIISYFVNRKKVTSSAFEASIGIAGLVLGIGSVAFMVITLIKPEFLIYVKMILCVVLMLFVIYEGINMLVEAIRNTWMLSGGMRFLNGLLGVLLVVTAIAGLCQGVGFVTIASFITFGTIMGFGLMMSGIGLMVSSFR